MKFLFWILVIYPVVIIFVAFNFDSKWFLGNLGVWAFLLLCWLTKAASSHE